jgi:hypothetical protein
MASDVSVRRILHLRTRTPNTDASQLLGLMRAALPFYQAFGGAKVRLLRNVDDPSQIVQVVEYETPEAFELNRSRIAGDPMLRTYMQTWRTMLSAAIEIDVYEDVTEVEATPPT